MDKVNEFPQYRMLSNGKHFYKITDDRNFEEVQLVGAKKHFFSFTAKKYPEILRIQDMLSDSTLFQVISEEKWTKVNK